jgi:hypothetical protein
MSRMTAVIAPIPERNMRGDRSRSVDDRNDDLHDLHVALDRAVRVLRNARVELVRRGEQRHERVRHDHDDGGEGHPADDQLDGGPHFGQELHAVPGDQGGNEAGQPSEDLLIVKDVVPARPAAQREPFDSGDEVAPRDAERDGTDDQQSRQAEQLDDGRVARELLDGRQLHEVGTITPRRRSWLYCDASCPAGSLAVAPGVPRADLFPVPGTREDRI